MGISVARPQRGSLIHCFQVELSLILGMLAFVEGGRSEFPEKNPQSRDKNQQQTQPT